LARDEELRAEVISLAGPGTIVPAGLRDERYLSKKSLSDALFYGSCARWSMSTLVT